MARFPTPPAELIALVDPRLHGAACAGRAPLFDERQDNETAAAAAERHWGAKRVCARCPVFEHCAQAAAELPKRQRHGVWAGHDIAYTTRKDTAA